MGLFDKKYCDICGEKIGLLGNRKLSDGNMCKDCAKGISLHLTERKQFSVADVKEHLADGSIHAVISQDAFSQGYFALRMLCEYLVYAKQPKYDRMFVRCDIILKENMIINDRIVNPYFMGD